MGLLICLICGHQRQVKPVKRNAKYRCTNCGLNKIIAISRKPKLVEDWGDKDGVTLEIAPYQVYAGLKRYAEAKRHKPGWPYVQFRKIFGRRPNGEAKVESGYPSFGLLLWIKQQNKAFVKRIREEEGRTEDTKRGMPKIRGSDTRSNKVMERKGEKLTTGTQINGKSRLADVRSRVLGGDDTDIGADVPTQSELMTEEDWNVRF